ncbi:MAG: antitoxin family protein [Pyrinomonadaceae bacterium]
MTKTLDAIFDGKVLRPAEPLDLAPDTRVRITIEPADELRDDNVNASDETPYPLTLILNEAADMGIPDLATNHHSYAHGGLKDHGDDA